MKRFILALALGAGLVACSNSATVTTAAGLSGVYDLTLVDRFIFVTSSDLNELRVLDLDAVPRDYVRAPNPLEPLGIPVLAHPQALTRDTGFSADGLEADGPYVYARSAGSREISVVGSARTQLRELRRLVAPALITAFASRGPATEGAPSQLFYATQSSAGAQLWEQDLPGPDALPTATLPSPRLVTTLPAGETVQAMVVLPQANQLAIATRSGATRTGRTLRLDVTAPNQFTTLNFGAPVRNLATHPIVKEVSATPETAKVLLQAGARIFGILDESACGGLAGCSGILSVDSATGEVSKDVTGNRMLPITTGLGLPTGLTLAPLADLLALDPDTNTRSIIRFPLLGIVPASNGQITIFDAVDLRQFDFDSAPAGADLVELRDKSDVAKTIDANNPPQLLAVGTVDGATHSDNYRVIYQWGLPGLTSLSHTAGDTSNQFAVPRDAADKTGAQVGDIVVLENDSGPCATADGTTIDLTVTQVVPGPSTTTLVTNQPVSAACADYPRFSVLSGGAKPFVVFSDTLGFIGRLGPNQPLTVGGDYFFHPDGFSPAVSPLQVSLELPIRPSGVTRGDRYFAAVNAHFVPYIIQLDTTTVSYGLTNFRLPGPVVFTKSADLIDYAYIAYPSASAILQVNLERTLYDALNVSQVTRFE